MKKFFVLLKVSLRSMLMVSSGLGKGKRKRAVSGIGAALMIAILGMYVSGVYSGLLMSVLAPLRMEILVFIFMGLAALMSGLMFTAFGVSGTLYGGKDKDLLLSLPVSTTTLVASKMFAVYLENLLFSFFMLVPAGVACALMSHTGAGQSVLFWVRLLLAAFLLPVLDTALSVLVGAVIAWLSSRAKHKAIGQNVIMAAFLIGVFWFSFHIEGLMSSLAANAAGIKAAMRWAKPVVWMGEGIMGDWGALAAFAGVCVLPAALVTFLLGKGYRKAVTAFTAVSARSGYKLADQRASGQIRALISKEARRFFGTPAYLWNAGLGLMMLVGMSVFAVVKRTDLAMLMGSVDLDGLLLPVLFALMGLFLTLCPISAPSFSLEGKQLWLLREAPVEEKTLIAVKTLFQVALAAPCILIAAGCLTAALGLSAAETAILIVLTMVLELGLACLGTLLGLIFARPDLDDTALLKRSLLSFLSIFGPMTLLGLMGVAVWLLSKAIGMTAALYSGALLVVVLTVVSAVLLSTKGPKLLKKL